MADTTCESLPAILSPVSDFAFKKIQNTICILYFVSEILLKVFYTALAAIDHAHGTMPSSECIEQEAQLMLTTGSTRLAVSRGQQTWYHSTCNI